MIEPEDKHVADMRITPRLVDSLYTEAMLLADEARTYFDDAGRQDRNNLPAQVRVGFACESLKVTTRIMHIVAWLLTQRAIENGEITRAQSAASDRRLGRANPTDETILAHLPDTAQRLIAQSSDLYARVERLDAGQDAATAVESPARALMGKLERDLFGSS